MMDLGSSSRMSLSSSPTRPVVSILTLTCAYALRRTKGRYGLVTMCIGGGQGIAVVLETISDH